MCLCVGGDVKPYSLTVPLRLPSSIIWYLARAFMLTRWLCGSGMGSNEQGEYCSSVFCSDLDRFIRDLISRDQ